MVYEVSIFIRLLPKKRIASLTFGDKEHPGLLVSDKSVSFDLLCTTPDKEQFIVEMQFRSQDSYKDRMLAYATYPIRMQLSQKLKAASGLKILRTVAVPCWSSWRIRSNGIRPERGGGVWLGEGYGTAGSGNCRPAAPAGHP